LKWRLRFTTAAALVTLSTGCFFRSQAAEIGKRSQYTLPFARLSVSFDDRTHVFEKVRVSFDTEKDPADEFYIIGPINDFQIKETSDGRQKFLHMEQPDKAYVISDFEAEVLNKVCKSFIGTLEIFEKDLHKERWDRCLYLDCYFPRFLKGFYYLYCAARNSPYAMPKSASVPDSLYDVSLTSPKTDQRIQAWITQRDYLIKLRIIAKELIYQLKEWQKKELDNPSRNVELPAGKKLEQAFTLFMKIYFNLTPAPVLPQDGEHL
jgi:hypothetical protein